MSATKSQKLNLLPQSQGSSQKTSSRILNWILTSFRIIVISTELIVIAAFLSRFALDAKGNDLSDEIDAKKAVILAYSEFENVFKTTQNKISIIQNASAQNTFSDTVGVIAQNTPSDIKILSISWESKTYTIKGRSFSELSIAQLISNLNSVKKFKKVNVVDVSSKQTDAFVTFEITAEEN